MCQPVPAAPSVLCTYVRLSFVTFARFWVQVVTAVVLQGTHNMRSLLTLYVLTAVICDAVIRLYCQRNLALTILIALAPTILCLRERKLRIHLRIHFRSIKKGSLSQSEAWTGYWILCCVCQLWLLSKGNLCSDCIYLL